LGSLKKDIEVSKKQMEACSAIESRMDLLEAVVEIFSKDGLPRFIMSQHLDHINTRMNDLLSKVVDFTVELRMDDEKGNLEVILKKRGKKRVAELGSGMERTLVSLALRVALRDISCIPMPDFFVVDEGFSMLDADNIMACKNLLLELKKIFRFVIVMTHNDTIKEMMDKTIEVTMPGEFSKLDSKVA
jgi:DNA repair exonuclease SbcCD ATPase subunit